jgi:hypothetical protein
MQFCSWALFAFQKLKFPPFLGGICMEGTLNMANFKILSMFFVPGPKYSYQKFRQDPIIVTESAVRFILRWNLNKTFIFPIWVGICMAGVPLGLKISKL